MHGGTVCLYVPPPRCWIHQRPIVGTLPVEAHCSLQRAALATELLRAKWGRMEADGFDSSGHTFEVPLPLPPLLVTKRCRTDGLAGRRLVTLARRCVQIQHRAYRGTVRHRSAVAN